MTARRTETVDERLARLRDATSALAPGDDLAARLARAAVLPARAGARRGLVGVVLPFGRGALVAAALAAAASVALALHTEGQGDDLAQTDDTGDLWVP